MNFRRSCYVLAVCGLLMVSCVYQGGERNKHELKRPDGTPVTCFEPPPEVVKKVAMDMDIDASAKEIGALAKASARGEVSPERIRDKLPSNVSAYEVIEFRMCLGYANGLYSPQEYRAFIDAKSGLLPAKESHRSPLNDGVSADSVRQHLIQFIEEANPLLEELDKAPTNVSEESKRKVVGWVVKVSTYLEGTFADPTYVLRFKNSVGLPPAEIPFSVHSFNEEYIQLRTSVVSRITRLNQFLDTIRDF